MQPVTGSSRSPGLPGDAAKASKASAPARAHAEEYAPRDMSLGRHNRPFCTGFVAPSRVQGTPIGGRRRQVSAPIKDTKDLQRERA